MASRENMSKSRKGPKQGSGADRRAKAKHSSQRVQVARRKQLGPGGS